MLPDHGETVNSDYPAVSSKMEDSISGIEDRMEEMDMLAKEKFKCKIFLTQNIQETTEKLWKKLRIIEIEGGELQLKGSENIFKKIIKNSSNLKNKMPISVQEVNRTPNSLYHKGKPPCHKIKTLNIQKK